MIWNFQFIANQLFLCFLLQAQSSVCKAEDSNVSIDPHETLMKGKPGESIILDVSLDAKATPTPQLLIENCSRTTSTCKSLRAGDKQTCIYCGNAFVPSENDSYIPHLQKHLNKINKDIRTDSEAELEYINNELKKDGWNIMASICDSEDCNCIFVNSSDLKKHILSTHEGFEFVCGKPECYRVFADKGKLRSHEIVDHTRVMHVTPPPPMKHDATTIAEILKQSKSPQTKLPVPRFSIKRTKCKCGKTFPTTAGLKSHIICEHPVMKLPENGLQFINTLLNSNIQEQYTFKVNKKNNGSSDKFNKLSVGVDEPHTPVIDDTTEVFSELLPYDFTEPGQVSDDVKQAIKDKIQGRNKNTREDCLLCSGESDSCIWCNYVGVAKDKLKISDKVTDEDEDRNLANLPETFVKTSTTAGKSDETTGNVIHKVGQTDEEAKVTEKSSAQSGNYQNKTGKFLKRTGISSKKGVEKTKDASAKTWELFDVAQYYVDESHKTGDVTCKSIGDTNKVSETNMQTGFCSDRIEETNEGIQYRMNEMASRSEHSNTEDGKSESEFRTKLRQQILVKRSKKNHAGKRKKNTLGTKKSKKSILGIFGSYLQTGESIADDSIINEISSRAQRKRIKLEIKVEETCIPDEPSDMESEQLNKSIKRKGNGKRKVKGSKKHKKNSVCEIKNKCKEGNDTGTKNEVVNESGKKVKHTKRKIVKKEVNNIEKRPVDSDAVTNQEETPVEVEKKEIFQCKNTGCKLVFESSDERRRHVEELHMAFRPDLAKFKCKTPGCFKGFYRKFDLNEHNHTCYNIFLVNANSQNEIVRSSVEHSGNELVFEATNTEQNETVDNDQNHTEPSKSSLGNIPQLCWYICPVKTCCYGSRQKADIYAHLKTSHVVLLKKMVVMSPT